MKDKLHLIYNKYASEVTYTGTDKDTCHSYIKIYEELFYPFQKTPISLLEIGVSGGYSIQMWLEYFETAHIYAVDNAWHVCRFIFPPERVTCINGNATKADTFETVPDLDIVVDDGSHYPEQQLSSLRLLYPKLKSKGVYIIEDIQDLESFKPQLDELVTNYVVYDLRHERKSKDNVLIAIFKD